MRSFERQIAHIFAQLPNTANVRVIIDFEADREFGQTIDRRDFRSGPALRHLSDRRMPEKGVIGWLNSELKRNPAPDFSLELLDSAEVARRMIRAGLEPLRGPAVNSMLKNAGFSKLKLIRVGNTPANYWSVYPEMFCDSYGNPMPSRVRDHLKPL